jgi:molybdopterin synthase sulfur carrier subunit
MQVTVKTIGPFIELLEFQEVTVDMKGLTVRDLLHQLSEELGGKFKDVIFDENGKLRRYIKLLVNGRGLHVLNGLETRLADKDIVALFPPVAGGCFVKSARC